MLTQEQLDKLFKYIEAPFSSTGLNRRFWLEDGLKLETLQNISDILNNANVMTNMEWIDWYNTYKDDKMVVLAGLSTTKVPRNVVKMVIDNFDIFSPTYKPTFTISDTTSIFLKYCVANDIDVKDFERVYNIIGMTAIYVLNFSNESYKSNKPWLNTISKDMTHFIIDKVLENYEKVKSLSMNSSLEELSFINDEKFLKTIFKDDAVVSSYSFTDAQKEYLRTAVINNPNISDEFRNELFFAGCVWKRLKNYITPEMAQELYDSAIDTFTNSYSKKYGRPMPSERVIYDDAKDLIEKMLTNHTLTDSMEYDLAQRILSRENKKMDYLTNQLFKETKNKEVLKLSPKLKSKDRDNAYKNPYIPTNLLQERLENFCEKMIKFYQKCQAEKIPDIWDYHISAGLDRCTLKEEYYDIIMKHSGIFSHIELMLSDKTPQHIKDKFYNQVKNGEYNHNGEAYYNLPYGYQVRTEVGYELLEFCKKYDISNEVKNHIKSYIRKIGPFTTNYDAYGGLEKMKTHYQLGFAMPLLEEIIEKVCISSKSDVQKLINFCKNQAGDAFITKNQTSKNDQKKNIYKFLTLALRDIQEKVNSIEKYKITNNVKDLTNEALNELLNSKTREIRYDKYALDFYLAINEFGEELYNLLIESEERNEIKKEKEEKVVEL